VFGSWTLPSPPQFSQIGLEVLLGARARWAWEASGQERGGQTLGLGSCRPLQGKGSSFQTPGFLGACSCAW
jgi:hypothetical protein